MRQEIEIKYQIRPDSFTAVTGFLRRTRRLKSFEFGEPKMVLLTDLYVDTAEKDLFSKHWGLRRRERDNVVGLTLKKMSAVSNSCLYQAVEFQVPCTPEGLAEMHKELVDRSLAFCQHPISSQPTWEQFLHSLGLTALVSLRIDRARTQVVPVGAIVVDKISLLCPAQPDHVSFEMEIEVSRSRMLPAAKVLKRILLSEFPFSLLPQRQNKLERAVRFLERETI